MFRGAPRLIALLFFNLPKNLLPQLFPSSYSSRQKASLCRILMCTIEDRPHAKSPPCMWLWVVVLMKRHLNHVTGMWWDCSYLFCAFAAPVDCQKMEAVRKTLSLLLAQIDVAAVICIVIMLKKTLLPYKGKWSCYVKESKKFKSTFLRQFY